MLKSSDEGTTTEVARPEWETRRDKFGSIVSKTKKAFDR